MIRDQIAYILLHRKWPDPTTCLKDVLIDIYNNGHEDYLNFSRVLNARFTTRRLLAIYRTKLCPNKTVEDFYVYDL